MSLVALGASNQLTPCLHVQFVWRGDGRSDSRRRTETLILRVTYRPTTGGAATIRAYGTSDVMTMLIKAGESNTMLSKQLLQLSVLLHDGVLVLHCAAVRLFELHYLLFQRFDIYLLALAMSSAQRVSLEHL